MIKTRIFLIDDDTEFRESVAELLVDEGFIVDEAPDGSAALQMMADKDFQPDMIMLDIAMPRMHGLEFIDRIRRVRPTVPIVVMSSKSWLQDDMAVQTSQQIRAFLVKPVDVNEILDVISKVCSEKSN